LRLPTAPAGNFDRSDQLSQYVVRSVTTPAGTSWSRSPLDSKASGPVLLAADPMTFPVI